MVTHDILETMLVVIQGSSQEMQTIDVVLMHDIREPDKLNAFFCPYCHNPQPLIQFKGHIVSITPGGGTLRMPIVKRCSNCKRNYSFNGVV